MASDRVGVGMRMSGDSGGAEYLSGPGLGIAVSRPARPGPKQLRSL